MPKRSSSTKAQDSGSLWLLLSLLCLLIAVPSAAVADWQAGLDALKSGDLKSAEQHFRQVAEDKPDWFGGHRMLGQTLLRQQKFAEAAASLRESYRLKPDDVGSRFDLGRALVKAESFDDAFKILGGPLPDALAAAHREQWLRLRVESARHSDCARSAADDLEILMKAQPEDAYLHYLASNAARDLDRPGEAREHMAAAVRLEPENPIYLAKRLTMDFAAAAKIDGADPTAHCKALTADGRRLVQLDPEIRYFKLAGRIESCAGHSAEAVALLSKVPGPGSSSWDLKYWEEVFHLGRHQLALGDMEAGAATLNGLLSHSDGARSKRIHNELGYAYQLRNRFDDAVRHYGAAGASERVAQAKEAQSVFDANQAEAARYAEEMEIRRKIKEAENELIASQNGH